MLFEAHFKGNKFCFKVFVTFGRLNFLFMIVHIQLSTTNVPSPIQLCSVHCTSSTFIVHLYNLWWPMLTNVIFQAYYIFCFEINMSNLLEWITDRFPYRNISEAFKNVDPLKFQVINSGTFLYQVLFKSTS